MLADLVFPDDLPDSQGRVAAAHQPLAGVIGCVISARLCSSNRLSCSGPPSAARAAMSGAFSTVTHPAPSSSRRSAIWVLVIIPRSPGEDEFFQPEIPTDLADCRREGLRVSGVPLEQVNA